MHHLILIAALAAATALGFLVFTHLLHDSDGTPVAESTIGTTAFLAAPALAGNALGWPLALATAAAALGICIAIVMLGPSAFLRRAAPWLSGSILLLCLPYIQI